ncbi:MAG: glycosyltransferase [Clostridia bacterium]|nr:glycosyltransferase [Clostridia bacterium]
MKLSFIIPVYKVENYLRECVDSVLAQSVDDCEIILVDDGSPDGCPAICDEYASAHPDRVIVIHKENGGLAQARNYGLAKARGDYIFFVDSDDYLIGDNVSALLERAYAANADVLHTSFFSIHENAGELKRVELPFEPDRLYTHADMEREICSASSKNRIAYVWRNLYRRAFLEDNGIAFEESLRMIEDAPFDIKAFCSAERFLAVDIPVYCYRIRDDSLQRKKYVEDYDLILEKQWKLKLEYYEQLCRPDPSFYRDLSEYTVKTLLYILLHNIYYNRVPNRYAILKRIADSEMMTASFKWYDINEYKSRSLDWVMTDLLRRHKYLPAHLICEKVLYK